MESSRQDEETIALENKIYKVLKSQNVFLGNL